MILTTGARGLGKFFERAVAPFAPSAEPADLNHQAGESFTLSNFRHSVGIIMPLAEKLGGSEHQLINLLTANLRGPRVNFCVCFLEHGPMVSEVESLGYQVIVIPAGRVRNGVKHLQTLLKLKRWVKECNVIYLISWMEKAHLYACSVGAWSNVRAAWWLRSIDPRGPKLRWIDRLPADHVFSCSRAAAVALRGDKPLKNITVCYSGFDSTVFDPDLLPDPLAIRRQLGLPTDRPIVALVARLQAWKGISVFIEAAASLLNTAQKPLFLIVGGDHALEIGVRKEADAQIARLHAEDDIRLVGYQSHAELWMQASDVIVHASIRPEPLGMVIVEGMALGKSVIATASGGPMEIISDGLNGRLVEPGNPQSLATAIVEALKPGDANAAMRRKAQERANDFTSERLASQLEAFLERRMAGDVPRLSEPISALVEV